MAWLHRLIAQRDGTAEDIARCSSASFHRTEADLHRPPLARCLPFERLGPDQRGKMRLVDLTGTDEQ